ncbi:cupin domain-containing protein [Paenibacillus sp. sptzw28]|uniref:cupin domain-containing protein n=1 Tax=Paenibacillus sp. sptzw28 TaxID=715179 RepID=UPI001C6F39FF|nr:cupin domain-containing protein [Paenibacillus sp. sptzw28]QYR21015.1 cupin domain-containing protein [Paenibacillus sp. sptzw28]
MMTDRDKVEVAYPFKGVERRVLAYNNKLMLVEHLIAKGSLFPLHSHYHEQIFYITEGKVRVICNNEEYEVKAGGSFVIPGGIEHSVYAIEDTVSLDIFNPAREDYMPQITV